MDMLGGGECLVVNRCLANGIYERAALLEPIMKEGMEMLANNHPCVKVVF